MIRILCFCFLPLAALSQTNSPPELLVTNVYRLVPVTSSTNAPPRAAKLVRRWQKECPECGHLCVSTNFHVSGSASTPDPNVFTRFLTVTFKCESPDCNEMFSDTIQEQRRKTPMIELPPTP